MGWLRTLLLGDIGNRLDIDDAERDLAALRRRVREKRGHDVDQDRRIDELEKTVKTLELGVATLSRLLVARRVLSEEDIAALVARVDDETES